MGLLERVAEDWLKGRTGGGDGLDEAGIEDLIARRIEARANKDFIESDRIRDELAAQGIALEDGAGGTSWRRE